MWYDLTWILMANKIGLLVSIKHERYIKIIKKERETLDLDNFSNIFYQ